MSTLRSVDLQFSYGAKDILKGISLATETGEIVGLLGRNGAGKTTLFSLLSGFNRPQLGQVFLDDCELTSLRVEERARLGLVYLPQKPSVLTRTTVIHNLQIVGEFIPDFEKAEIERLLSEFDLFELRDQSVMTLSGGERRKLEIVRALLLGPRFLLLDEPFAGLDSVTIDELCAHLRRLSEHVGILICDHRELEVSQLTHRNYRLADGMLTEES